MGSTPDNEQNWDRAGIWRADHVYLGQMKALARQPVIITPSEKVLSSWLHIK
jgi:hypothetical protein